MEVIRDIRREGILVRILERERGWERRRERKGCRHFLGSSH